MIGFDELLRMRKKSSLDSRATIHQVQDRTVVVATPEPTANSSTPVHHQQGRRTLTPSRSCDGLVATSTFCSSGKWGREKKSKTDSRFNLPLALLLQSEAKIWNFEVELFFLSCSKLYYSYTSFDTLTTNIWV